MDGKRMVIRMKEYPADDILRCPRCKLRRMNVRKNGSRRCGACGYIDEVKEVEE